MRLKLFVLLFLTAQCCHAQDKLSFYAADHSFIQYTGRIDFTDPLLPRFWQPGVYINFKFSGTTCDVILNDEVLWDKNHNYIEVVVDGQPTRLQTKTKHDTIKVASGLPEGIHTVQLVKNTEANIGYLELVGIRCKELLMPDEKPLHKIEFIGNSITCGAGADISVVPCHKGLWHDQHNAYMAYAAVTARTLNAQYHLSSVSGIGLMHSCCGMDVIMPRVFDKVSMRNDTIAWDFKKYVPDVVTVCLGQNDGLQNFPRFVNNYVDFLKKLRTYYPDATIICLSSPMADDSLRDFMRETIKEITKILKNAGDKKVLYYIFKKQYINGCDSHPDIAEHAEIAKLLTAFIKKQMKW